MLRRLYAALPISPEQRARISARVPLRWRRQPQFRRFGTINELYFWRLDRDIDTVAPVQNFFSFLFPHLDTATEGWLWVYDRDGKQVAQRRFEVPHAGMHVLRLSEFVDRGLGHGTLMWHLRMPDRIATDPEVRANLVYFTDRGYLLYEKSGCQPCFIHGVDRYAVFQRQEEERYDLFYAGGRGTRSWVAELPLRRGMQEELEVVLLNRSAQQHEFSVGVHRNGGEQIHSARAAVQPRGAGLVLLNADVLSRLGDTEGYLRIDGIPTQWGRPALMRHFAGGAISTMHC
jgi:hypothetical protein